MTSSWWKRRWRRTTRGWSPSARSGLPWYCLGAPTPPRGATRGRGRFARLLDLARRFDLPVILHAPHGAAVAALEALKRHGIDRAVFHWHKAPPR